MKRKWVSLILFFVLSFAVAGVGAWMTEVGPGSWYDRLQKPEFNPPRWVFGPVWMVLYFLIAVSGWLVRRQRDSAERRYALLFWVIQLALNLLWSWLFFSLHLPGAALLEILLLWFSIGAYVIAAWMVNLRASILFFPYWAWVTFATLLNLSIWWLN